MVERRDSMKYDVMSGASIYRTGMESTLSEHHQQNAVKKGKSRIRNLFYCQNNSHYKQTVLYYIANNNTDMTLTK
jgi:hypothetical protein